MNYRNLNYEDPNDIKKAILNLSCCTSSGSGSGLELGAELIGGDPNAVLYLNGSSQLETNSLFSYDGQTLDLSSGDVNVEALTLAHPVFPTSKLAFHVQNLTSIAFNNATISTRGLNGQWGFGETRFTPEAIGHFKSSDTSTIGAIIDTPTGQTANLQEWRVNGTQYLSIDISGRLVSSQNSIFNLRPGGGDLALLGNSGGNYFSWDTSGNYLTTGTITAESGFKFGTGGAFGEITISGNFIRNGGNISLSTNVGTQLRANMSGGVDIFEWLGVTNDDVAQVPMTVDAITGTTANIQEWQVNGTSLIEVTSAGTLRAPATSTYLNLGQGSSIAIRINGNGFRAHGLAAFDTGIKGYSLNQTKIYTSGSLKRIEFWNDAQSATVGHVEDNGLVYTGSDVLIGSKDSLSDNSGASAGTLSNAPSAGDPTKWIAIDDNGTTRYIPTWT